MTHDSDADDGRWTRRAILGASAASLAGLAGCTGGNGTGTNTTPGTTNGTTRYTTQANVGNVTMDDFRGSGAFVENRDITATSMDELPDLSGSLSIYLGGGEAGLYVNLLNLLKKRYPDFEPSVRDASSSQLASTIIEEVKAGVDGADVFWAVDAGSLGIVAKRGATTTIPASAIDQVPKAFHPNNQWVGVAGRARSIPYNTNAYEASDIPEDVFAFPDNPDLVGSMGWAPSYGAFQSFVTAMRVLNGEQKTKQWLRDMMNAGITEYPDEFLVSNAVADGAIRAGFANHYYALRVKAARPQAPLDLAFTSNDAASLINVAGAEIIKNTQNKELAVNFIRHLLSAEAQEFFATRTFAYPMVSGVPPVGSLPRIDELNPPELDLTKLSNLQPTLRIMREVGLL